MREQDREMEDKVCRAIWYAGLIVFCILCIFFVMERYTAFSLHNLGYTCWVHKMTGLYCPGCGGTRAVIALVHGEWIQSFCHHPVVLYAVSVYSVYMLRGLGAVLTKGRLPFMKLRLIYVYIGITIIIVQFVVKNIALVCFHIRWIA